ncbi:helix-turn-helix domain-containing protein [Sphingobacterium lactis]|uniref:helix-turn-helix domain-containing protein n=1 Tax=Sphingobacterium lactis TaxID=797291 RepID=UPI003F7DF975
MFKNYNRFNLLISIFFLLLIVHVPLMINKFDLQIGLLYGPILLFAYFSLNKLSANKTIATLHFLPFFFFSITYLTALNRLTITYVIMFDAVNLISLLSYSIYILRRTVRDIKLNEKLKMLLLEILCLFGLAVSFFLSIGIANRFYKFNSGVNTEFIIISISVFSIVILIGYFISKYTNVNTQVYYKLAESNVTLTDELTITQKNYCIERFTNSMEKDRLFLDAKLTEEKLLKFTGMTDKCLDFFLMQHLELEFEDWVAKYRVNHALALLNSDNPDVKVEFLANLSGFPSKAEFNKYFKLYTGYSATEYRSRKMIKS